MIILITQTMNDLQYFQSQGPQIILLNIDKSQNSVSNSNRNGKSLIHGIVQKLAFN